MSHETSVKLSIPRSGSARMTLDVGGNTVASQCQTFAAWQSPEKGAPRRVVIRLDGKVEQYGDGSGNPFFPCVVACVRYTTGGISQEVLIDCVNQSALTVWAESVDVTAQWDQRRITRMASLGLEVPTLPCLSQTVAASCSSAVDGDTGPADARYLDCIAVDGSDGTTEWSVHPIPAGARGVRFLDAITAGGVVSTPGLTSVIMFSSNDESALKASNLQTNGAVEFLTNGATDTAVNIVPVGARNLVLYFPLGTIATFTQPAWLEWIMAPQTLPALS